MPPLVQHPVLRFDIGPVPRIFCSSSSSSVVSDSVYSSSVSDSMSDQENHHRHHQINQKVVLGFLRNNCCSFFCRVSHLPEIRHIIKSLISLQSAERTDPKVRVSGPLKFKTLKCSVTQIYKSFNYTHTRKFYFLLHL